MARILHTQASERYRANAVATPRDKGGVTPAVFAIALATAVAFGPAVAFGFVYDDHWTVEGNSALGGPLFPLLGKLLLGRGAAAGIPDSTRPTMVTSLWLDRRLFGLDPAGHHLHSLVLYAAACVLAAACVFAVVRRTRAAVVGGLLFAVAPVHAEVAASINYREDLEAAVAVFALTAALFLPRRQGARQHALGAALLAVGLFGKESAVVLFPMTVVIALTRFELAPWVKSRRSCLTVLVAVTALWGAWRAWLKWTGRDDVPLALGHRGILDRLLRTARYAVQATIDGIVQFNWSPEYAPAGPASPLWLLPFAALVGAAWALSKHRRYRVVATGLAIAIVAPLVTSPLLSPINERADRYVFIGSLGGAVLWGALIDRALARVPERVRIVAVVGLLLPFVVTSHRAVAPFRSDADLWRIAAERAPLSPRAFAGLARVRRLSGDLDGADRAVERALALDPRSLMARVTLVYNRIARGNVDAAKAEIRAIEALGGRDHRGMRRAVRCAALPPKEAAACIDRP
jgi:protein O-mannosyl-transferase